MFAHHLSMCVCRPRLVPAPDARVHLSRPCPSPSPTFAAAVQLVAHDGRNRRDVIHPRLINLSPYYIPDLSVSPDFLFRVI
jgi:hypothetical protein